MKKKMIIRVISIVLVISLFWQGVAWTTPADSLQSIVRSPQMLGDIYIPEQYGTIEKSVNSPKSPQVILIKDAHCHYEAQKNIWQILDHLYKRYKISLICIEGAWSKLDHNIFGFYPDKEYKKRFVEEYMKNGLFTGAESFCIVEGDHNISLAGIEDPFLYLENLKVFKNVWSGNAKIIEVIKSFKDVIRRIKDRKFDKGLIKFDNAVWMYRNNESNLSEFIKMLEGYKDIPFGCETRKVIKSLEMEESIDFNKINKERDGLMVNITDKEILNRYLRMTMEFKIGLMPSDEYYRHLKYLIAENRKLIKYCPINLLQYIKAKQYMKGVDNNKLFMELEQIIDRIYKNYGEQVYEIAQIEQRLYTIEKMALLRVSKREVEQFSEDPAAYSMERIYEFLKKNTDEYINADEFEYIDLTGAGNFYMLANLRDSAIAENVIRKMRDEGQEKAVLIVGGYHADGVKRILEGKGIDVQVVSPNITKEDNCFTGIYLSRMLDVNIDPEQLQGSIMQYVLQAILPLQFRPLLKGPAKKFLEGIDMSRIDPKDKPYIEQLGKIAGIDDKESESVRAGNIKAFVEWYNGLDELDRKRLVELAGCILQQMTEKERQDALATLKLPGKEDVKIPKRIEVIFNNMQNNKDDDGVEIRKIPKKRQYLLERLHKDLKLESNLDMILNAGFVVIDSTKDNLNEEGRPLYAVSRVINQTLYICVTKKYYEKLKGINEDRLLLELLNHEYMEKVQFKSESNPHQKSADGTYKFAEISQGKFINLSPFHKFVFNSHKGDIRYFLSLILEERGKKEGEAGKYEEFFIKQAYKYLLVSLPNGFPEGLISKFKEDREHSEESKINAFALCAEAYGRSDESSQDRLIFREAAKSFLGEGSALAKEIDKVIICCAQINDIKPRDIIGEIKETKTQLFDEKRDKDITNIKQKMEVLRRVYGTHVILHFLDDNGCNVGLKVVNKEGKLLPHIYISRKLFDIARPNLLEMLLKNSNIISLLSFYKHLWEIYKHDQALLQSAMGLASVSLDSHKKLAYVEDSIRHIESKLKEMGINPDDKIHSQFLRFLRLKEIYAEKQNMELAGQYALCAYQIGKTIAKTIAETIAEKEPLQKEKWNKILEKWNKILNALREELPGNVMVRGGLLPEEEPEKLLTAVYAKADKNGDVMEKYQLGEIRPEDHSKLKEWLSYNIRINNADRTIMEFFNRGGEIYLVKGSYLIKKVGNKLYINDELWDAFFSDTTKLSALFFLLTITLGKKGQDEEQEFLSQEEIKELVSLPRWNNVLELFKTATKLDENDPVSDVWKTIEAKAKVAIEDTVREKYEKIKIRTYSRIVIQKLLGWLFAAGILIGLLGFILYKQFSVPDTSELQDNYDDPGVIGQVSQVCRHTICGMDELAGRIAQEYGESLGMDKTTAIAILSAVSKTEISGEVADIDMLVNKIRSESKWDMLGMKLKGLLEDLRSRDITIKQWHIAMYILAEAEKNGYSKEEVKELGGLVDSGFAGKIAKAYDLFIEFKERTAKLPLLRGDMTKAVSHLKQKMPNPAYNKFDGERVVNDLGDGVIYKMPSEAFLDSVIKIINERNNEEVIKINAGYDEKFNSILDFVTERANSSVPNGIDDITYGLIRESFRKHFIKLYNKIAEAGYGHTEVIVGYNKFYIVQEVVKVNKDVTADEDAINKEYDLINNAVDTVEKMLGGSSYSVVHTDRLLRIKMTPGKKTTKSSFDDNNDLFGYARAVELFAAVPQTGFRVIFIGHSSDGYAGEVGGEDINSGLWPFNNYRSIGIDLKSDAGRAAGIKAKVYFWPGDRYIDLACGSNADYLKKIGPKGIAKIEVENVRDWGGFKVMAELGYTPAYTSKVLTEGNVPGVGEVENKLPQAVKDDLKGKAPVPEVRRLINPPEEFPGLQNGVLYAEVGTPEQPDIIILNSNFYDGLDGARLEELNEFIAAASSLLPAERVQQTPFLNNKDIVRGFLDIRRQLSNQGVDIEWFEEFLSIPNVKIEQPFYVKFKGGGDRWVIKLLSFKEPYLHIQPDIASPHVLIGIKRNKGEGLNELFKKAGMLESKITSRQISYFFVTPDGEYMEFFEKGGKQFVTVAKGVYKELKAVVYNGNTVWEEGAEEYVADNNGELILRPSIVSASNVQGEERSKMGMLWESMPYPVENAVMQQGLLFPFGSDLKWDIDTIYYFVLVSMLELLAVGIYQAKLRHDMQLVHGAEGAERVFSDFFKKAGFSRAMMRSKGVIPLWLIDREAVIEAIKWLFKVDDKKAGELYAHIMKYISEVKIARLKWNLFGSFPKIRKRFAKFFKRVADKKERLGRELTDKVITALQGFGVERGVVKNAIRRAEMMEEEALYESILLKAEKKGIGIDFVNALLLKLNTVITRYPRQVLVIADSIIEELNPFGEIKGVLDSYGIGEKEALILIWLLKGTLQDRWGYVKGKLGEMFDINDMDKLEHVYRIIGAQPKGVPSFISGEDAVSGALDAFIERIRQYKELRGANLRGDVSIELDLPEHIIEGVDFASSGVTVKKEDVTPLISNSQAVRSIIEMGFAKGEDYLKNLEGKGVFISIPEEEIFGEINGSDEEGWKIHFVPVLQGFLERLEKRGINVRIQLRVSKERMEKVGRIVELMNMGDRVEVANRFKNAMNIEQLRERLEKDYGNRIVIGMSQEEVSSIDKRSGMVKVKRMVKDNKIKSFGLEEFPIFLFLQYALFQASIERLFENEEYTKEGKEIVRFLENFGIPASYIEDVLSKNEPFIYLQTTEALLSIFALQKLYIEISV